MSKCALVTGASRGIRPDIATHLAKQGYGLTIGARGLDSGLRGAGAKELDFAATGMTDFLDRPDGTDAGVEDQGMQRPQPLGMRVSDSVRGLCLAVSRAATDGYRT